MKKFLIFITVSIIVMVFSCSKKENLSLKTNSTVSASPSHQPFIKGKYEGIYVNTVDITDTVFVYTEIISIWSYGDTVESIDSKGEGKYRLFCKHNSDYLGKDWICIYPKYNCGITLISTDMETINGQLMTYSKNCPPSTVSYTILPVTYYLNNITIPYTIKIQYEYHPCNSPTSTTTIYTYKKQ